MQQKYYWIFGILLVLVLIGLIFVIKQPNGTSPLSEITQEKLNSLNETQCKQSGYEFVGIPGPCTRNDRGEYVCGSGGRCDIPTKDAGKKCYSNAECEGACLCSKNEKDSEGFQIGECSIYKYFTEVADCPCILETKSTNPNHPYGCA